MRRILALLTLMMLMCSSALAAKVAVFTTSMGSFEIKLEDKYAPGTVKNFVNLVNKGFYNGLTFHRVIDNFMIQGGCPNGDGTGGPGYEIKGEFTQNGFKNDLKHTRGVLSMARTMDPNSAGSQFFIMHVDYPYLDNQYATFGKVIEGLEVIDAIAEQPTDYNDRPRADQVMAEVTVETFGVTYPEPEKV